MRSLGVLFLASLLLTAWSGRSSGEEEVVEWLGVPAGGLRFDLTETVFLESQRVYLSLDRVRVRYRLINGGTEDQTLTVGFPFPSLPEPAPPQPSLAGAFNDASLTADGSPLIVHRVGGRLYSEGRDVTDLLGAARIEEERLADGGLYTLTRAEYRRLERALTDRGLPRPSRYDWSFAVEPRWRVTVPARGALELELAYTPYPGLSIDRFTRRDRLSDLAHLQGYCAEEQPRLLPWMQEAIDQRLAEGAREAAVRRYELAYRWEELPEAKAERSLRIEARPGAEAEAAEARIAFCFPGGVAALPDGTHLAGGYGEPQEDRLDVIFLE